MARKSQREIKRQRNQLFIAIFVSAIILTIVGVFIYYTFFMPKVGQIDATSLCPAEGPKGHYVLLVDKTDPLTFTQNEAFSITLREIIEKRTPEGYLLSVFLLGEDFKENAKPLVELCNPGTGADKSKFNANLKQLKRQYQERFLNPLLEKSDLLLATKPAKTSPIFEMLQLVAINAFRKHDVKGERRLIIMSDMLHNTPQFSMYKGPVDYQTFTISDYGRKSHLELPDVEVEIHYLINTPQLQTKRNVKFWEDYFNKAGARIVAVQPLEG
jgi:hypothetical protein